jgi:hypothetical protein
MMNGLDGAILIPSDLPWCSSIKPKYPGEVYKRITHRTGHCVQLINTLLLHVAA